MKEEVIEMRHNKTLQEDTNIFNGSVSESLRKMKEEVLEMRHKMLQEHPEMFNRLNANGGISKTVVGMRNNFATWKGTSRYEVPSFDCREKEVDQC